MHKLGRLMCPGLLSLLFAAAAHGAVTWTATLGFSGSVPAYGWCPVLVDIQNDGPAAPARLSVPAEAAASQYDPHRGPVDGTQMVVSRDLQLPAGGRLRCFLYIPITMGTSVGLQVGAESQTIRLSSRTYGHSTRTVVVIGGGPERLLHPLDGLPLQPPPPGAGPSDPDNSPLFAIAQVPWPDLPDEWLGWSGVSAVVLADRQWAQASAAAQQALLQWVRLGGTLIVPGGALASAYPADLRAVLPVQADALNLQGSLAPVGRWLGVSLPPPPVVLAGGAGRPGSGTLCAVAGQPLVATGALGSGEIIMTAFDYAAPLVAEWTLQVDLWRRLIGMAKPLPQLTLASGGFAGAPRARGLGSDVLAQLAGAMPQARRLPWRGMVLCLLVYVALLGPGQLLLMRRRGRHWSWLLTLGIIVCFTLSAFAIGAALRGRQVVIYRASSLETQSGEPAGNGASAVGLFSPGRGSYRFTTQPSRIGVAGYLWPSTGLSRLSQDTPWRLDMGPTPLWTLKIAQLAFPADLGQGLQARALWNGQNLQVRVTNGTGLTLREFQVLADERKAQADQPLAPSQTVELWYDHSVRPDRPVESRGMSGVSYGPPPLSPVKPGQLVEEMARRGREATEAASDLNAANPVLLAVTTDPVAPLVLTGRRARVEDVTLLRVPLRATLAQGATVDIPSWLVERRSLLPDNDESRWPPREKPTPRLLEYRLPVGPRGVKPLSLGFIMPEQPVAAHGSSEPDGQHQTDATHVAAFNFRTGSWQALPRDTDCWRVPTPEQFLTDDGRLQLRYDLPDLLPSRMSRGSGQLHTMPQVKAVLRAW